MRKEAAPPKDGTPSPKQGVKKRKVARKGFVGSALVFLQSRAGIMLVLAIAAFITRMIPLGISSYPYNNDSLTEGTIAGDILASGHLDFPSWRSYSDTHSVLTPAFNVLIAFFSSALGVEPLEVIQVIVAFLSVVTISGAYLMLTRLSSSIAGGLAGAIALLVFGTFVFVTASGWKGSLGMVFLVLLVYAYMNRSDKRMLVLEIIVLVLLPFVHHLAAAVGYLFLWYLTVWSLFFATARRSVSRRHIIDTAIVVIASLFAYGYYYTGSLDRLVSIQSGLGILALISAFIALCLVSILVLRMQKHSKISFAPLFAIGLFAILVWDYYDPIFSYTSGSPGMIVALISAVSVLVAISWYGLEKSIESTSYYRAIPIGLLLPFLTLVLLIILQGIDFGGTQMLYRTFDYVDLAIAAGIAVTVAYSRKSWSGTKNAAVLAVVLASLLVTLPFAYATPELTGVRHDTQAYEVDCLDWLNASSAPDTLVQSDERLSYIAMALYDYEKMPWLPRRLAEEPSLGVGAFYVLEDEWTTKGVNAFPGGYFVLDEYKVRSTLETSDVLYQGGPASNNIVLFRASPVGEDS